MRTTIDLPDELLRRAKSTAALRGVKLKDLIASFIEQGLGISSSPRVARGHLRPLPEFVKRTGHPLPSLTNAQIEDILLRGEIETLDHNRSS